MTFKMQGFARGSALAQKILLLVLIGLSIVAALLTVFPFLWSAILATHDRSTIFGGGIPLYFGDHLQENYDKLLEMLPFWQSMANSFYVATLGTSISLLFCSLGGYAFGVYEFKGKQSLFTLMLATMMIPPVVGLIPFYLIVKMLGLLDTLSSVWLPFTATPFGIFLIRQYVVSSIPKELLEAAKLDGAGEFRTYWSVVLPLLKPSLATLGIVQFVFFWNNFLTPLIALNSRDKYVVTLALRSIQNNPNAPWGTVMLGTSIAILPLLVFYMLMSKKIIAGLTSGAVKT
ncbi:MAG: carbohydrate ABC transporter permease [Proteobacteria bacterium]|nr:carbohydrate ABC transporter permease [Pseudomonadota bacterium]